MSSDCKFGEHIRNCVKATQKIASWMLRTFRTRSKEIMRTLLKSIIIPKAEYASIIWSPTNAAYINKIENIQRRYTSRIAEYQTYDPELKMPICTTNYWDRLDDLLLFSLERRRERFQILYIYRYIIGIIELDCFEVFVERGIKVRRRSNPAAPQPIRDIRQHSFLTWTLYPST